MKKSGETSVADWLGRDDPGAGFAPLSLHRSELTGAVGRGAGAAAAPLSEAELEELRLAHRRWGADAATMNAVERLGGANARVVVAGQQPGLLAGPLYTLYKALGAAARARELAAAHPDLDFIPVFWVASEDHDFEEIRSAVWPAAGGATGGIALDPSLHRPGAMVGPIRFEGFADRLAAEVESSTHPTEFRPGVIELLRRVFADGRSVEDAFCTLLLALTRGRGLVIVSPLMSWVRRRAIPVMRREIELAGGSTAAILARSEELEREGYPAPMHRRPGAVNLFRIDKEGRRETVATDGDTFVIRPASDEAESRRTRGEMLDEIERDPASWSFNVVTRPVVQDSILPTVAQLVGPGEAAYLAQVEAAYPLFCVAPATRLPRPGGVLLTGPVERALAKCGVSAEEALANGGEGLMKTLLARGDDGEAIRSLAEIRARHEAELRSALRAYDASAPVQSALDKLFQSAAKGYANVESRILAESERRSSDLRAAADRIEAWLRPQGRPQERVFNPVVPFMIQYGPDWPGRLEEMIAAAPGAAARVVRLSG